MNLKNSYVKLLGIASVGALLVGCGPGKSDSAQTENTTSDSGEKQKLVVWEDIDKAMGIEDAVAEFEEMHDVEIEVIEK